MDATWGGSGAGTYVSITDANSFITASIIDYSEWSESPSLKQQAALCQATQDIDSCQYIGNRYYNHQLLEFPRAIPSDISDGNIQVGSIFSTYEHSRMKLSTQKATCFQALWLLRNSGRNTHSERIAAGIQAVSEKTGDISDYVRYNLTSKRLCPEALAFVSPWLTSKKVYRG